RGCQAEVLQGQADAERVVELARNREGFLEVRGGAVKIAAHHGSPTDVVQAVRERDHVADLALECENVLRGGGVGAGEEQQALRWFPGVGELREERPAPLEQSLPRRGVAALAGDEGEPCKRHRFYGDLSCCLRCLRSAS